MSQCHTIQIHLNQWVRLPTTQIDIAAFHGLWFSQLDGVVVGNATLEEPKVIVLSWSCFTCQDTCVSTSGHGYANGNNYVAYQAQHNFNEKCWEPTLAWCDSVVALSHEPVGFFGWSISKSTHHLLKVSPTQIPANVNSRLIRVLNPFHKSDVGKKLWPKFMVQV